MREEPTFYQFEAAPPKSDGRYGSITFKTNNTDLYSRIIDYINDMIDAHQWRTRTQQIRICDDSDAE